MKYPDIYTSDLYRSLIQVPGISDLYNKSILITGATGMIGSALVDALLQLNTQQDANIKVYGASRSEEKIRNRFKFHPIGNTVSFVSFEDIVKEKIDNTFDYIIHAAAPANPREYSLRPVETINAIVNSTYSLLRKCVENKGTKLLYVSSSEVYGKKSNDLAYKEDEYGYVDVLNSRSCYPSAKRVAETLCASFSHEYGAFTVIVRPGHIYGPTMTTADNRVASDFVRLAVAQQDIVLKSTGEQLRSHCYIADCVSAIFTVLINGKCGNAYNISNRSSVSTIIEYAECVSNITGVNIVFDIPSENEKKAFNPMQNASLDASRLEALGWNGIYDLKTGIEHTVKIIKESE